MYREGRILETARILAQLIADPPENFHLNVKKNCQKLDFFFLIAKNCLFFSKKNFASQMAIFWRVSIQGYGPWFIWDGKDDIELYLFSSTFESYFLSFKPLLLLTLKTVFLYKTYFSSYFSLIYRMSITFSCGQVNTRLGTTLALGHTWNSFWKKCLKCLNCTSVHLEWDYMLTLLHDWWTLKKNSSLIGSYLVMSALILWAKQQTLSK